MAEELQYASAPDSSSHKRKLEDRSTPPPPSASTRRTTGFSAPIASQSPDSVQPPSSYSTVPSHRDEIEIAKQRAQEIAARLFNDVESKRTRVDNVGGGGGYDSSDSTGFSSGIYQKPMFNATPSMMTSYGQQGPSKKIEIPNGRVGVIIGKAGETIKYLQLQSGAKIQITRDMDADPNSPTRTVEIVGTPDQIVRAEQLINDVLAEAESGGSGIVSRRITGQPGGAEKFVMKVPNNKVGLVIGKGGETIKNMQASSGARIQVIPLHLPPGDTSTERTVQIDGSSEQIEAAKQLVNEVISENRVRNPGTAGGYPQQGYQAQPPTNWAPPVQQPSYGYGYNQTQYSTPQQPYPNSGYPPTQQSTQVGEYNSYYNQPPPQQQQTPPGPTDNTASYGNYGGYPGFAPQSGYSQQQGYNNPTPGYGTASNQTLGGQTPPPFQQSSPNPSYPPPQGTTQSGYGVPPSGQGGYGYPVSQPPTAQSGYAQQPSGYGTQSAGPGYASVQYGAQTVPYTGGSYGSGGYSQPPPVYTGDGNARGTYDSTPAAASHVAQPGAAAKSSPQS